MEYDKLEPDSNLSSFEAELSDSDDKTKDAKKNSKANAYGTMSDNNGDNGDAATGSHKMLPMGEKERHIMLIVMGIVSFIGNTQFSMIGPFYPQYAHEKNATSLTIGIVIGSFEVAVFLSSPFWGSVISKVGGKPMYIGGVLGTSTFAVLFGTLAFIPNDKLFIGLSVMLRLLMGFCDGAYSVASYALVIYAFPEKVASVLGILEAFQATGIMLGPIVGSALYEAGGFFVPFIVVSGILVIVGLSITCIIPIYTDDQPRTMSACRLLTIPMLLLCASFQTTVSSIVAMSDSVLALHLQTFGLSPIKIGAVFLAGPGTYIIFTPINGFFADKKPSWSYGQVMICFAIAGLSLTLLGPAPIWGIDDGPLWLIIFSLLLFGSSASALVVAVSLMFRSARQAGWPDSLETYGLVSGFLRSAGALGGASGAVFGGLIFGAFGFDWGATAAGITLWIQVFLMAVLVLALYCIRRRKTEEDTLPLSSSSQSINMDQKTS